MINDIYFKEREKCISLCLTFCLFLLSFSQLVSVQCLSVCPMSIPLMPYFTLSLSVCLSVACVSFYFSYCLFVCCLCVLSVFLPVFLLLVCLSLCLNACLLVDTDFPNATANFLPSTEPWQCKTSLSFFNCWVSLIWNERIKLSNISSFPTSTNQESL